MSQLEASEQNIDEAINYAVKATQSAPNDPATFLQAGLLFYGKKDYQNAVNGLQRALELDPNNSNIAYFLALSLRDGGRTDLAKQLADELLRRNPGNADLTAFLKSLEPAPASTSTKATSKTTTKAK
jgi:tetratricopeptide (TPR) repeat protein